LTVRGGGDEDEEVVGCIMLLPSAFFAFGKIDEG
jgi:hypothetical protein